MKKLNIDKTNDEYNIFNDSTLLSKYYYDIKAKKGKMILIIRTLLREIFSKQDNIKIVDSLSIETIEKKKNSRYLLKKIEKKSIHISLTKLGLFRLGEPCNNNERKNLVLNSNKEELEYNQIISPGNNRVIPFYFHMKEIENQIIIRYTNRIKEAIKFIKNNKKISHYKKNIAKKAIKLIDEINKVAFFESLNTIPLIYNAIMKVNSVIKPEYSTVYNIWNDLSGNAIDLFPKGPREILIRTSNRIKNMLNSYNINIIRDIGNDNQIIFLQQMLKSQIIEYLNKDNLNNIHRYLYTHKKDNEKIETELLNYYTMNRIYKKYKINSYIKTKSDDICDIKLIPAIQQNEVYHNQAIIPSLNIINNIGNLYNRKQKTLDPTLKPPNPIKKLDGFCEYYNKSIKDIKDQINKINKKIIDKNKKDYNKIIKIYNDLVDEYNIYNCKI